MLFHGTAARFVESIREQGHAFYLSENGVWLTEHVPPELIEFPENQGRIDVQTAVSASEG